MGRWEGAECVVVRLRRNRCSSLWQQLARTHLGSNRAPAAAGRTWRRLALARGRFGGNVADRAPAPSTSAASVAACPCCRGRRWRRRRLLVTHPAVSIAVLYSWSQSCRHL